MASNTYIETTAGLGGAKLDTRKTSVAGGELHRQRVIIAGQGDDQTEDVVPLNTHPSSTTYGLPTRIVGTANTETVDLVDAVIKIGSTTQNLTEPEFGDGYVKSLWLLGNGGLVVHPYPYLTGKVHLLGDATARAVTRALVGGHAGGLAINTTQTVISAVASNYIYVIGFEIAGTTAAHASFEATTGGANLYNLFIGDGVAPTVRWAPPGAFLFRSGLADGINLLGSAAATVSGTIHYVTSTVAIA